MAKISYRKYDNKCAKLQWTLKKSIAFFWTLLFSSALTASIAQTKRMPDTSLRRCATMEVLNKKILSNSFLSEQWRVEGENKYRAHLRRQQLPPLKPSSIFKTDVEGTAVIPVVVHIVSATPGNISDRDVADQIEVLNVVFAGKNKDAGGLSPEFLKRFGRAKIQFALARRTPNGSLTGGIERINNSKRFTIDNYNDIKHANKGGADAWDINTYYNIWVGVFSDNILGVSSFPFETPVNEQGTVINERAFGVNPCQTASSFNQGKTLVHETGHFFYLYHIWGDDNGSCTGSDFSFQQGYPLPAVCSDDTPNQSDASSGYLGGYITDTCSRFKPGINYANYMDYVDDVAYSMFTNNQVCRMEHTLNIYRNALKNSDAMIPPAGITDAYLVSVTPGTAPCGITLPVCANSNIIATLQNTGLVTLSSVVFNIQYDFGAVITVPWTGSLSTGERTTVSLGSINLSTGLYTVKIYTSSPNGGNDAFKGNDTIVKRLRIAANTVTAPLSENFENTVFPPVAWSVSNPDNRDTWQRTVVAHAGHASAVKLNYRDSVKGQWDDLATPPILHNNADSATLSFWIAYKQSKKFTDGLEIWLSNTCGSDYQPVYRVSSGSLATIREISDSEYAPDNPNQWRKEKINLTPYLIPDQPLLIAFRNINGEGNNLFLDDIEIDTKIKTNNDAIVDRIDIPDFQCDGGIITPHVIVKNAGLNNITSLKLLYAIDDNTPSSIIWTGNLLPNDTVLITLKDINTTQMQHTFVAYTSLPNNMPDGNVGNDTLQKTFTLFPSISKLLKEGFENSSFLPVGWGTSNPDNNITWRKVRKAKTLLQTGDTSAIYLNSFNYADNNTDEIRTPVIEYTDADSLFVLYDIASTNFISSNNATDTLEILLTTDCGKSYTSVRKLYGHVLFTVTAKAGDYLPSAVSDYRRDSIDLTNILSTTAGSFQLVFKYTSNYNNNTYIDNVHIYAKTLPAELKEQGYLIYPNPVSSTVTVQHYRTPANLKAVCIYNIAGGKLYQALYNGNAGGNISIDLSHFASGVYIIQLVYTDHTVSQKILKAGN